MYYLICIILDSNTHLIHPLPRAVASPRHRTRLRSCRRLALLTKST